jgi:hypothetical protein
LAGRVQKCCAGNRGERAILKLPFVENAAATMIRRLLNHVRTLSAALVALLTFGATFIATGAEDADSTINAMSEADKQFRIPMSNSVMNILGIRRSSRQ